MKVLDLLKVVDGDELVSIMNKAGSSWHVFASGCCERFARGGSIDPLMDKKIVSVFVDVIEPYGLPGLNVIVE